VFGSADTFLTLIYTMLSSLFRACKSQPIRTRPFFTSSFSSSTRRYATAPLPRRLASNPPPVSGTLKSRTTSSNLNDIRKLRKVELAERLYNSGNTLLYKAGGRLRAYRIRCYVGALLCVAAIQLNIHVKMFDFEELKRRGIPKFVGGIYILVGIFLSAVAAWCINRAHGQIQSIQLVKKLDSVFMEVTATRRIPFLKRRFLVTPYDMQVDSRLIAFKKVPTWMLTRDLNESSPSAVTASVIKNTARVVSRSFFHVFSAFRQFFQQTGMLSVYFTHTAGGSNTNYETLSLDMGGEYLMKEGEQDKQVLFDLTDIVHRD